MAALAGCASGPVPPDWQMNAQGAAERAVAAYLEGNTRAEALEFDRMRREIARTGQPERLARAELVRCATRVASLEVGPCSAFEALRSDAAPPERAYADYLAARVQMQDVALLPPQHQAAARASAGEVATLAAMADPLARLVAAGVWFQSGRANPAVVRLAVETASSQGWSRPLLAWLQVQARHAEAVGDAEEAARVRRRIAIVLQPGASGMGTAPAAAAASAPVRP